MPVPEPSPEGGLWASVKPVTGWPETDEDRLAQLAGDWRSGAQRFSTTGGFDLSGLGGIWPDPAGAAAGVRARGTLVDVMGTGDGMTMLAARVDAFAGSVRGCKIDIGRIVEVNIPGYTTALRLPPGLAESDATNIRTSVIAQINERIGGCVREIGGLGLQPTDLPVGAGAQGGTFGGLLAGEQNPTTVADPLPPWAQTGGGPLVRVPGLPGLPGAGGHGPGDPPGIIVNTEGADQGEPPAGEYEWPKPDVPTDVLEPGEGWDPSKGEPILGRQPDTKVGRDWPDHDTLNTGTWTQEKNDAYIQTIIDQQSPVYAGSPTQDNYWNVQGQHPTVYAREVQQLLQAGYTWRGNYLEPPG
jgi:hypothetical protein